MLWPTKSLSEKSSVSHTQIFHQEGLGQTSLKISESKISGAWSEATGDTLRVAKDSEPKVSVISSPGQGAVPRVSSNCLMVPVTTKLSSDKTKRYSNKLPVLYSRGNNPWIGGVHCLTASEHPS